MNAKASLAHPRVLWILLGEQEGLPREGDALARPYRTVEFLSRQREGRAVQAVGMVCTGLEGREQR